MSPNRLCAALALVAALTVPPARGQISTSSPDRGEAWREQQLIDLAEVLGRVHYLRVICIGRGDQRWREYMRSVLDREPVLRRALSDSFNDGYRNEAARFPDCNADARQVEEQMRARGVRIASALSAQGGEQRDD